MTLEHNKAPELEHIFDDVPGTLNIKDMLAERVRRYLASLPQEPASQEARHAFAFGPLGCQCKKCGAIWAESNGVNTNGPCRASAAPSPARAEAVPAGFKLVPVEPTVEMLTAGAGLADLYAYSPRGVYAAMLAASPAEPARVQGPMLHTPSGFAFDEVLSAVDPASLIPLTPAAQGAVPLTDEQFDLIAADGMRNAAGGIYATSVYEFGRAAIAEFCRVNGITAPAADLREPGAVG